MASPQARSSVGALHSTRWHGDDVQGHTGSLEQIASRLPTFRRQFLALPSTDAARSVVNFARHLIVRESGSRDEDAMPIAVVSPRYSLVQHTAVLAHAVLALEAAKIATDDVTCDLLITTNGERMRLRLTLPASYAFDPGDGHPMALRLECFNSVDGSTRFMAVVGWLRFVCANGLVVGATRAKLRQRHDGGLSIGRIGAVLTDGLRSATAERALYSDWLKREVTPDRVAKWIDLHVANALGKSTAARAYHIIRTGHDAVFEDPFERAAPSARRMKPGRPVPGSGSTWNAYATAQALAWLARERRDVQEQLDRAREIPKLMRQLLN